MMLSEKSLTDGALIHFEHIYPAILQVVSNVHRPMCHFYRLVY